MEGIMTTQERQEYAAQLKREMNYCQAVVRAFADTLNMPEDKLMQLAAGFGSGMGTMEGTCGALVGAIMVAGLRTGGNGTMALSRKILPRPQGHWNRQNLMQLRELRPQRRPRGGHLGDSQDRRIDTRAYRNLHGTPRCDRGVLFVDGLCVRPVGTMLLYYRQTAISVCL